MFNTTEHEEVSTRVFFQGGANQTDLFQNVAMSEKKYPVIITGCCITTLKEHILKADYLHTVHAVFC